MDRIARNTPTTVSVLFATDDTPVSADSAVTVTVLKADGSALYTDQATILDTPGLYKYMLPGQALLNDLTLRWTGTFSGLPRTETTYAEIVGGHYFTVYELRKYDSAITASRFPAEEVKQKRIQVEDEFYRCTGRSFVHRYSRETHDIRADGSIELLHRNLAEVYVLTVDGVDMLAEVTSGDITAEGDDSRVVNFPYWYSEGSEVIIEYEYGFSAAPPTEINQVAKQRARGKLMKYNARIDERATVMQVEGIGMLRLGVPGRRGACTGIAEIDTVLTDNSAEGEGSGVTIR